MSVAGKYRVTRETRSDIIITNRQPDTLMRGPLTFSYTFMLMLNKGQMHSWRGRWEP